MSEDLHVFKYAGETFAISPDGNVLRAVSWGHDGEPAWAPVLRAVKLSVVSVALDGVAQEFNRLRAAREKGAGNAVEAERK